jgi:uncharacterized protein YceH (UPF0502 family)
MHLLSGPPADLGGEIGVTAAPRRVDEALQAEIAELRHSVGELRDEIASLRTALARLSTSRESDGS